MERYASHCANFCRECVGTCVGCSKWKLRRDYRQENKEQEMSYKPTSSCTLKNIAEKIHETGCSEAKAEFADIILNRGIWKYNSEYWFSNIYKKGSLFKLITSTEERRNWLLKFGYIEEEISLKPCPFCLQSSPIRYEKKADLKHTVVCDLTKGGCGSSVLTTSSKSRAIKAWNTRK